MRNIFLQSLSIISFILFLCILFSVSAKQVFAQSCSGNLVCGLKITKVCNPVGCLPGIDPGCSCTDQCGVSGGTVNASCAGYPSVAACNAQSICEVYVALCLKSGSCSYTPPSGGGAICGDGTCNGSETCTTCPSDCGSCSGGGGGPPPPPGGYGACGGCGGCPGTNPSQCRTDPTGACVWDPSGCGAGSNPPPQPAWQWISYKLFPSIGTNTIPQGVAFNEWVDPNDDSTAYVDFHLIGGSGHFMSGPVETSQQTNGVGGTLFGPTYWRATLKHTTSGLTTVSDKQWGVRMVADGPSPLTVRADVYTTGAGYLAMTYQYTRTWNVTPVCAPDMTLTANGTANSVTVPAGTPVTLDWSGWKTANCTASDAWSGAKAVAGSEVIPGAAINRIFTLTCDAAVGAQPIKVTKTVAVNIQGLPALPTMNFTINSLNDPVVYTYHADWATTFGDYNTIFKFNLTNAASCTGVTTPQDSGVYPYPGPWPYTPGGGMWLFDWTYNTSQTGLFNLVSVSDAPWKGYGQFKLSCTGPGGTNSRAISVSSTIPAGTCSVGVCAAPAPQTPPAGVCALGPGIARLTNWTWAAIPNADSYYFSILDSANAVVIAKSLRTAASLGCAAGPTCGATASLLPGKTYHAVVSSHHTAGICSPDSASISSAPFTLSLCASDIKSTVQNDTTNNAKIVAGACTVAGATVYSGGGSISAETVPAGTTYTGSVDAVGNYTISSVPSRSTPNGYDITFVPPASQFVTCPVGGTYANVTVPTNPNLPFFVSPVAENWYQTVGGEIAALNPSGTAVNNPIPVSFCVGTGCSPYFTLPLIAGKPETAGALLVNNGVTVDLSNAAGTQTSNVGNPSYFVATSTAPTLKEGYDYFYRLYSMGVSPSNNDFTTGSQLQSNAKLPGGPPDQGRAAYYSDGDLTIDTDWKLVGNRDKVIFVNGNLIINKEITMDNKSFVAFIVKGNITITKDVGTATFTQTNNGQVQGMYLADGTLTVASAGPAGTELKFIGEGTFAARGGINLPRDFRNGGNGPENNNGPASLFIYRPDLIENVPEQMKTPTYVWKEVSP